MTTSDLLQVGNDLSGAEVVDLRPNRCRSSVQCACRDRNRLVLGDRDRLIVDRPIPLARISGSLHVPLHFKILTNRKNIRKLQTSVLLCRG